MSYIEHARIPLLHIACPNRTCTSRSVIKSNSNKRLDFMAVQIPLKPHNMVRFLFITYLVNKPLRTLHEPYKLSLARTRYGYCARSCMYKYKTALSCMWYGLEEIFVVDMFHNC